MIFSLAIHLAAMQETGNEALIKDLSKIAGSKAAVCVQSWIDNAPSHRNIRFSFLDSKLTLVGETINSSELKDIRLSPDGTMVAAASETYVGGKSMYETDIFVVNKEGLLAKTHLNSACKMIWVGGSLILEGTMGLFSTIRFGPDPALKGWSTKRILDRNSSLAFAEGECFWSSHVSENRKNHSFNQFDLEGKLQKTIELSKICTVEINPARTPYFLMSSFNYVGDGVGGFCSLSAFNLDTGKEQQLAKEVEPNQFVWVSGPGLFGYISSPGRLGQMAFYSPSTGRSFSLGPGSMFFPSCAVLDADTVLAVHSGKTAYKLKPGKMSFERVEIPNVAKPDKVYACR